jgi:glycosyltransferase involved in cell wall biosynthesis
MCTYNGARYLPAQLQSIAAQTRPPDELIVCDDGSTDETRRMVADFASSSSFPVRAYVNERNLGAAQNFARAISLCEGDVIALADQDDYWLTGKLARVEREFDARAGAGLVFTDAEMIDEDSRPLGYRAWQSEWVKFGAFEKRLVEDGRSLEVLLARNVVTGASMAFRTELRELILPVPDEPGLLHDYWIALVAAAVSRLAYVDEPLVGYRRHAAQHTGLPPPDAASPRWDASAYKPAHLVLNPFFGSLCERLRERAGEDERARRGVERIEHLRTRAAMRGRSFARRSLSALRELGALRYHRYSGGWRDAAEDVALPHKLARLTSRAEKTGDSPRKGSL